MDREEMIALIYYNAKDLAPMGTPLDELKRRITFLTSNLPDTVLESLLKSTYPRDLEGYLNHIFALRNEVIKMKEIVARATDLSLYAMAAVYDYFGPNCEKILPGLSSLIYAHSGDVAAVMSDLLPSYPTLHLYELCGRCSHPSGSTSIETFLSMFFSTIRHSLADISKDPPMWMDEPKSRQEIERFLAHFVVQCHILPNKSLLTYIMNIAARFPEIQNLSLLTTTIQSIETSEAYKNAVNQANKITEKENIATLIDKIAAQLKDLYTQNAAKNSMTIRANSPAEEIVTTVVVDIEETDKTFIEILQILTRTYSTANELFINFQQLLRLTNKGTIAIPGQNRHILLNLTLNPNFSRDEVLLVGHNVNTAPSRSVIYNKNLFSYRENLSPVTYSPDFYKATYELIKTNPSERPAELQNLPFPIGAVRIKNTSYKNLPALHSIDEMYTNVYVCLCPVDLFAQHEDFSLFKVYGLVHASTIIEIMNRNPEYNTKTRWQRNSTTLESALYDAKIDKLANKFLKP